MQLINSNFPWKIGAKQIRTAEEKFPKKCIFYSIDKDPGPNNGVKMQQNYFFRFLVPFVVYMSNYSYTWVFDLF